MPIAKSKIASGKSGKDTTVETIDAVEKIDALQDLPQQMPDVANGGLEKPLGTLDWVGMGDIALPLQVMDPEVGSQGVQSKIQAYVSLDDANAKGIHMSRLFLLLEELACSGALTQHSLRTLLESFISSHKGLSDNAFLKFKFDYFIRRKSLKSANYGWKSYQVEVTGTIRKGQMQTELYVEVPYSSTCPCSAALARQLIKDKFQEDFGERETVPVEWVKSWLSSEQGVVATPHSQRSIAQVRVNLGGVEQGFPIKRLVDIIEDALQTPVQAAVKREDEQEFARLNGQNLMFCEDAARRLKNSLIKHDYLLDFWVRVNHLESLHAHDAVSVVTKGVADGYQPIP